MHGIASYCLDSDLISILLCAISVFSASVVVFVNNSLTTEKTEIAQRNPNQGHYFFSTRNAGDRGQLHHFIKNFLTNGNALALKTHCF